MKNISTTKLFHIPKIEKPIFNKKHTLEIKLPNDSIKIEK